LKFTDEQKSNLSESQKIAQNRPEVKALNSKLNSGERNGFYGKRHSIKSRQIISEKTKSGMTESRRDKISEDHKGKKISHDIRLRTARTLSKFHYVIFGKRYESAYEAALDLKENVGNVSKRCAAKTFPEWRRYKKC